MQIGHLTWSKWLYWIYWKEKVTMNHTPFLLTSHFLQTWYRRPSIRWSCKCGSLGRTGGWKKKTTIGLIGRWWKPQFFNQSFGVSKAISRVETACGTAWNGMKRHVDDPPSMPRRTRRTSEACRWCWAHSWPWMEAPMSNGHLRTWGYGLVMDV